MNTKHTILTLYIIVTLSLTGCANIAGHFGYTTLNSANKQLNELRAEAADASAKKDKEIQQTYQKIIDAKVAQMQAAVNTLYGADIAFSFYKDPTRLDNIIHNRTIEAVAAIGIPPTVQAIQQQTDRLKAEMDETKTSLHKLESDHNQQVKMNSSLVAEAAKRELEMSNLKEERAQQEKDYAKKIADAQSEVDNITNKLLQKQQQEIQNNKQNKEEKMWLIGVFTFLGVIFTVGAVSVPDLKLKFAILAVIFLSISVAIVFVSPVVIACAASLPFIGVICWITYDLIRSKIANRNIFSGIQDIKNNKPAEYASVVAPSLKAWNTKYDKNGNVIPDTKTENYIDKTLQQMNIK